MNYANQVMNQYKGNENAWMTVDAIITRCNDNNTKFFALQILDEAIKVSITHTTTTKFCLMIVLWL